ncbi:hypothetical protein RhiirB3_525341 [Rhizophagus irregularis]|nr:hypothetical protein RhiirB3_525341 [Rhizophagus irregularis]
MFHFVFGEHKKLAKKPKPWQINLLLELTRSDWLRIKNKIMQKFDSTCKDVEYRIAIDLLDNLIPPILDVYAILFRSGSFEKYVETCSTCLWPWISFGLLCVYCENFYKNGIYENVNAFLKRIEKGTDMLTQDDLDDEIIEDEEEGTEETECEQTDISVALALAINNINYYDSHITSYIYINIII